MSKQIDHAEVVELAGADAETFAQSQFINDVSTLAAGEWQWSAWLDPQGRVRYLFALLRPQPGQLLAWLPRGKAADMVTDLTRFVFRSRLTIESLPDASLVETPMLEKTPMTMAADGDGWSIDMPGTPLRQATIRRQQSESAIDRARQLEWQFADVAAGLPWVPTEVSAEYTASALGLEQLAAVSLTKGCYPGQEIVARLHYRGGNKRHCVRLSIEGDQVPASGESVFKDLSDTPAGRILHAAKSPDVGIQALAVLPADLTDGTGLRLACGRRIGLVEHGKTSAANP